MCGRFHLNIDGDFKGVPLKFTRGDVFPSEICPIMNQNKEIKHLKWGFPIEGLNKLIINARSETIIDKRTFRDLLENNRCVIPAEFFYDWDKNKIKYKVSLKNIDRFSMAGVYKKCIDKNKKEFWGFVIITTSANREMSKIHHRMPVIFDREAEEKWLSNEEDIFKVKNLLKPYKDGVLKVESQAKTEQIKFNI